MNPESELYIIKEFEGGNVLVGDHYGGTQYLTKAEYDLYLKNRANIITTKDLQDIDQANEEIK